MMIVGLTGGIGGGKSTVAKMFRDLDVPVYDSDLEAKQLMTNSSELKEAVKNLIGEGAYDGDTLNRSFIANRIFRDPEVLKKLNAIVHPAVKKHFLKWTEKQDASYVIQETALIFENDSQDQYDHIVLVTAPLDLRLKRVMSRDGVKDQEVLDRMKNQMDDNEKEAFSHFLIHNIDLETTKQRVEEIHHRLVGLAD